MSFVRTWVRPVAWWVVVGMLAACSRPASVAPTDGPGPATAVPRVSATPVPASPTTAVTETPALAGTATPLPSPNTPTTLAGATHTVQAGENLFRLALRYGVTVDDLKAANGLTSDLIDVGQVLVIPVGARPTLAPQVTSPGDVLPPTPPSS